MQIFRLQKMLKLVSLSLETKADMTSHFRTDLRYFVAQYRLKEMPGIGQEVTRSMLQNLIFIDKFLDDL